MVREAEQSDLDAILQLYLFLHEDRIPEKDEHLRDTWLQIIQDPNHHLIVKMMLLTGSKKPETLQFYEKCGYNSSDKTAFIQWLGMEK